MVRLVSRSGGGGGSSFAPTNPTRASLGRRVLYADGADGIWLPMEIRDMIFAGALQNGTVNVAVNTTLSGILACAELNIAAGVTLDTGGYPVFVDGAINFGAGASISRNGINAAGAAGGPALANTFYAGAGAGANGAVGAGAGSGGAFPAGGGRGGNGATGISFGGSSGSALAPFASDLGANAISFLWMYLSGRTVGTYAFISGGTGGGGGGGDGIANSGGGGGGGGGIVIVLCRTWTGNGLIAAKGGDGAAGLGINAGGGGGGAGGVVYLYHEADFASQNYQAGSTSGGTGGGHANVPRQRTLTLSTGDTLTIDVSGGQGGASGGGVAGTGARGDPGNIVPTSQ